MPISRLFALAVSAAFMSVAWPAHAEELKCPAFAPVIPPPEKPLPPGALPRVTADKAQVAGADGSSTLTGSVRLEHEGRVLEADQMQYDRGEKFITASGGVKYQDPDVGLRAKNAEARLDTGAARFGETEFSLRRQRARGSADEISTDGKGVAELRNAQYTTCNKGDKDWLLTADRIKLDKDNTTGTARNAVLRFKGVPILYTPYFSYPIGVDRKTGFLVPRVGNSDSNGVEVAAPYYLNLRPNLDATVTPRMLAERGTQLVTETRFLGRRNEGTVELEYLPTDEKAIRDRYLGHWDHRGLLSDDWSYRLDATRVSDDDYFVDLDSSIGSASLTHVQQAAQINYQNPTGWLTFRAHAQDFQIVNSVLPAAVQEPYARIPQLKLDLVSPRYWYFQPALETEFTRFDRSIGETGNRIDIHPALALGVDRDAWFAQARATYRVTEYDLENRAAGLEDKPERSLPSYSFDSGVRFERLTAGGRVHTLEPRLFYLNIPFRDQSELPLFDTVTPDFETWELFTENRFTGIDRIGDANQLTAALSSSLIDPDTGTMAVRGTLGQIYYFDNQRITLPSLNAPSDPNHSDFVAAADLVLSDAWSSHLSLQWNPDDDEFNRASAGVRYRTDADQIFNVGYRFRRNLLEQTDLSFIWPLSPRWRVIGRWNYALDLNRDVESLAGFEYGSCCWALRGAWRRFLSAAPGEYDDGLFIQLELRGLGSIGRSIEENLERDVRGYINH